MNKIAEEFIKSGLVKIQQGGLWFVMSKDNSMKFIECCQQEGIEIFGINGFYLHSPVGIEPSMANSIDFTLDALTISNNYIKALQFIKTKDDDLYFEIVFDDEND